MTKLASAAEAISRIPEGATLATAGFVGIGFPETLALALGQRFDASGGLEVECGDGSLRIVNEGKIAKFIDQVDYLAFSGAYASERGQRILYITERAVFELDSSGLRLVEIAPGIDLESDILAHMGFEPAIAPKLHTMDAALFRE